MADYKRIELLTRQSRAGYNNSPEYIADLKKQSEKRARLEPPKTSFKKVLALKKHQQEENKEKEQEKVTPDEIPEKTTKNNPMIGLSHPGQINQRKSKIIIKG